jgi:hypothetical protein
MNKTAFVKFITHPMTVALVDSYLVTRAEAETLRGIVDRIYTDYLTDHPIRVAAKWRESSREMQEFITGSNDSYLADDAEWEGLFIEIDKRTRAAGIKPDSMERDYCPALVAENNAREAARQLVKHAAPMFDVNFDSLMGSLENYYKFRDLVVSAVVSHPSYISPLEKYGVK